MSKPANASGAQGGSSLDSRSLSRGRIAWEAFTSVLLALFFFQFLVINGRELIAAFRFSTIVLVIKVGMDVVFYLIRRMPKDVSVSPYDWTAALLGTFIVMFFRADPNGTDNLLGQAMQTVGLAMQLAVVFSLNRSTGIVPANRGIRTKGMYALVRHPLYTSYVLAYGGYLLNNSTPHNTMIYCSAILLWVLRMFAEERLLTRDRLYREYSQKVRWRVMPYVF